MPCENVNTIMLTTKCSGGCTHCPFSDPQLEELFLSPQKVPKIINKKKSRLNIISGGEPFEHPNVSEILTRLRDQTHLFRIATGGFIDLLPWITLLKTLVKPYGALEGISVGTDAISSRVNHSNWVPTWEKNIRLFYEHQIPYSLTFTAGKDLDFSRLNLWKWATFFDDAPEFIYLRVNAILLEKWTYKIQKTFHDIPIIHDCFLDNEPLCT